MNQPEYIELSTENPLPDIPPGMQYRGMQGNNLEECTQEYTRKYKLDPQTVYYAKGKTTVTCWIVEPAPVTERGNALIIFAVMVAILAAIVCCGFPGAGW